MANQPFQILVHGEQRNMMRLKSKLLSQYVKSNSDVKVFSPRNCEELRIPFKADKIAKVVGKLATVPVPKDISSNATNGTAPDGPLVTGVLVQNDFKLSLMAPEDLREYAGLNTTTITCKQRLTLSAAGIELVKWALEGTFGTIEELPEMRRAQQTQGAIMTDGDDAENVEDADEEVAELVAAYLVMGCVTVRYRTNGEVELEWEGNMLNDGIADSVMAVLFSVESSPAAVKRSGATNGHSHSHSHDLPKTNPHANVSAEDRLQRMFWFLETQFGADNVSPVAEPKLPGLETDADAMATDDADGAAPKVEEDESLLEERRRAEIERLHKIGVPVPGVSITVDKMTATVWLENLDVECTNKAFSDRVRAVVDRAVEVTAPLWA